MIYVLVCLLIVLLQLVFNHCQMLSIDWFCVNMLICGIVGFIAAIVDEPEEMDSWMWSTALSFVVAGTLFLTRFMH